MHQGRNAIGFWSSNEQKTGFSLGTTVPTDSFSLANQQNRPKSLYRLLITGIASECFHTEDPKTNLKQTESSFINRFKDRHDQYK